MVRLTKIYTRAGDGGQTRLVGGQLVPKEDLRIEAYGTVDELNSVLGMARELARESALPQENKEEFDAFFQEVQNNLFNLGSDLATRIEDRWEGQPLVESADTQSLENLIDQWNEELCDLTSFVLPGGNKTGAALHMARTICRRAERQVVGLSRHEEIGAEVIPYINRLSDALFVLSRRVVHLCNNDEILWTPRHSA